MSTQKPASKRHFTAAARAAAIEGRRRKREAAPPKDAPEVFVVRKPDNDLVFGWEIRRFGALVIEKGGAGYSTIHDARTAGESALSALGVEA